MPRDDEPIDFAWCKAMGSHISVGWTVKLDTGGEIQIDEIVQRGKDYFLIADDGHGQPFHAPIESVRKIIYSKG